MAFLLGLAVSFGFATRVPAATTWTVCASGCEYSSIKAAIAAPTTRDGDTLAIGAGTYTEAGIAVNKSLTLLGEGAATTVVQAAATQNTATDRVFTIPSNVTVTLQNLTIQHGRTGQNGGGVANSGTATLINCTVRGNSSIRYEGGGGGVQNYGILTLINTTLSGNSAEGDCIEDKCGGDNFGGGLGNLGTATLINSTVLGNWSEDFGGGVFNWATLTLISSTVHGNTAAYGGGGLYNSFGLLTLTHSTVSSNTAPYGAGLYNSSGRHTLTHSILANNLVSGDCQTADGASSVSHGYNLDGDGSCQLTAPTDMPSTDPRLGPLQDNGGQTVTQALLPGSPALDAIPWGANGCGTSLLSDQRWQARPEAVGGGCDSGAYEVAVAGHSLSAWVAGLTPDTAACENVTAGQRVTLSAPAAAWDCEAAGLEVSSGDEVVLRVRGPVTRGATDVGGAVTGMAPTSGGCTNRTTGQEVKFQALFQGQRGATAVSCVAAGLVVQPGDEVQMRVRGAAE